MNYPPVLRADKARVNTVVYLITEGLKYCCPRFFWQRYQDVPNVLLAARLGVDPSTISKHKSRYLAGDFVCSKHLKCLDKRLNKVPSP